MENHRSSSSSLLLKRRAASRPDIKGAKTANTNATPSGNNSTRTQKTSNSKRHGPRKYFYNVTSFQLIVPCRLGHRGPGGTTSLLTLLEMPRPNIHHLLHILNHHTEVCPVLLFSSRYDVENRRQPHSALSLLSSAVLSSHLLCRVLHSQVVWSCLAVLMCWNLAVLLWFHITEHRCEARFRWRHPSDAGMQ